MKKTTQQIDEHRVYVDAVKTMIAEIDAAARLAISSRTEHNAAEYRRLLNIGQEFAQAVGDTKLGQYFGNAIERAKHSITAKRYA